MNFQAAPYARSNAKVVKITITNPRVTSSSHQQAS